MANGSQKTTERVEPKVHWPFGTRNYTLFAVALADIIAGFLLLHNGSMTAAPILLVLGFCVLVPASIVVNGRDSGPDVPSDRG